MLETFDRIAITDSEKQQETNAVWAMYISMAMLVRYLIHACNTTTYYVYFSQTDDIYMWILFINSLKALGKTKQEVNGFYYANIQHYLVLSVSTDFNWCHFDFWKCNPLFWSIVVFYMLAPCLSYSVSIGVTF